MNIETKYEKLLQDFNKLKVDYDLPSDKCLLYFFINSII